MTAQGTEVLAKTKNSLTKQDGGLIMAGLILAGGTAFMSITQNAPSVSEQVYTGNLTSEGQCLNDTAYDPSQGASIVVSHDATTGHEVLTISPRDTAVSDMGLMLNAQLDEPNTHFTFVDGDKAAQELFNTCS